jgi:hypothetical protein
MFNTQAKSPLIPSSHHAGLFSPVPQGSSQPPLWPLRLLSPRRIGRRRSLFPPNYRKEHR